MEASTRVAHQRESDDPYVQCRVVLKPLIKESKERKLFFVAIGHQRLQSELLIILFPDYKVYAVGIKKQLPLTLI